MTQTETPAPAEGMIKLDASQWDQFAAQSDRTKPSPYQGAVDGAKVGDMFAVPLPIGDDGPEGDRTIVNNLHKAARTAGKNIHVMVRRNTTPPAVLWRILDGGYAPTTRAPKTAVAPASAEGDSTE